ncbi:MerR family transcriptional regulator [Janibacter alittae]|uniref:MerR family transcriptional regulator n=1 Tax=Janibacter alittae TaxID=3115209 RepID=A0ABZ2ML64_9MICO
MYTIKRAAELTGVPAATLRAWERRYGVIEPERTEAGYRVYDEESLARIRALASLVADGWTPSQAAKEVARVAPTAKGAPPGPEIVLRTLAADPIPADASAAGNRTEHLVDAAARLDAAAVARVLDERFAAGSFESVVDGWLMPALAEVGDAWADQRISVAGEHLVAHAVLRRLATSYDAAASRPGGPTVIVGLPAEVHHELGIFAFAVALRRGGLDVVYLGPNLPADAWCAAMDVHVARCAVLAIPRAQDAPAAQAVIDALSASHPTVPVAVGGDRQGDVGGALVTALGHALGPAAAALTASLTAEP